MTARAALPAAAALAVWVCAAAQAAPAAPAAPAAGGERAANVLGPESSAAEILRSCRAMLPPKPVLLRGRIVRRNRKGIPSREYAYSLLMDRSSDPARIEAKIYPKDGGQEILSVRVTRPEGGQATVETVAPGGATERPPVTGTVLGTDVTWLDFTLDFLWWPDARFDAERTGETVHGQECLTIIARPAAPQAGVDAVRLWADRKTGCMMQAEQLASDGKGGFKTVRRLWGTRLKQFPGHETAPGGRRIETKRWMASAIEVQRAGGIHRTKITIESIDDEPSGPEGR